MGEQNRCIYEFGPFHLDPQRRVLLREGEPVKLYPKEFDTLLALVERNGEGVDKDELMRRVWGDTVVEEGNLAKNISSLRKILGEKPDQHQYIVTVPGHGYLFVASVRTAAFDEVVVRERTRATVELEEVRGATDRAAPVPRTDGGRADLNGAEQAADARALPASTVIRGPLASRLRRYRLIGVVSIAALALVAFYSWTKPPRTAAPAERSAAPQIKSMAVLPFRPLVDASRDESLEMGMADTLITKLSSVREIVVRPMSAVRKYAGPEQDAIAAGREQRVDAVLDGSIQKSGEKVRVTVRLARVADGTALWTSQFDEKFTDIFAVQDSISLRVAAALAVKLTGEEQELLAKRYTQSAEAYQEYIIGRYHWNKRSEESLKKSIKHFDRAIQKDPAFALAYTGLSDTYLLLANQRALPPDAFLKAKEAAVKAIDLDDGLAEAHASLASVKWVYELDRSGAAAEFRRAIELDPNYATAHHWYALFLMASGLRDEAAAEIRRAQELDPTSLIINTNMAYIFYLSRQYDQAIEQARKALELDEDFVLPYLLLGFAYGQKGMFEEAVAEFRRAALIEEDRALPALGYGYAVAGKRQEAQKVLNELNLLSKQWYIGSGDVALIHIGLGDKDQAFAYLHKAYEERAELLRWLRVDPRVDGLRTDPRFADLLRRVGLAQ